MEDLDARSASEMSVQAMHVLGFSDLMFAAEAQRADQNAFEHALRNVIRSIEKERVQETQRSDAGKSIHSDESRAVGGHSLPSPDENGFFFERVRGGDETCRVVSAGAVDLSVEPQQGLAGNVSQARTPPFSGMAAESSVITHLPAADPIENNGTVALENALPTGISWSATFSEAVDLLQQYQASRVDELALEPAPADTPEFGEAATAGFLREIARANRIRTLDLSMSAAAKTELKGEWTGFRGLTGASAENVVPEPVAGGYGETVAFVRAEMLLVEQDKAFLTQSLWSQSGPEERSSLATVGLPRSPFDGVLLQALPEQPIQSAVAHVAEVGREHLFDQLVQGVRVAQTTEATEVLVHLKPDFLGRLNIRVLADEHGMRVEIRAENEAVRQVMQDNLADLQQRLAEKDIAFNQLSILADTGWHSRRESEWSRQATAVGPENEPDIATEVTAETVPLTQSGTIDYLA